ncbi:hypothetical protein C8Q77DRAFT_350861 [Trametes polyzona]|nr:hypothetical protein C8Q77DRAFT_350861 [Trametes polyzona]
MYIPIHCQSTRPLECERPLPERHANTATIVAAHLAESRCMSTYMLKNRHTYMLMIVCKLGHHIYVHRLGNVPGNISVNVFINVTRNFGAYFHADVDTHVVQRGITTITTSVREVHADIAVYIRSGVATVVSVEDMMNIGQDVPGHISSHTRPYVHLNVLKDAYSERATVVLTNVLSYILPNFSADVRSKLPRGDDTYDVFPSAFRLDKLIHSLLIDLRR